MKKGVAVALKFLVSGALIWFLLSRVDLGDAKTRIAEVAPDMLLLATFIFFVQIAIAVFRWQVVLAAIGAPLRFAKAFALTYIGIFFNQTLPSSVGGDAVRIYKAYRGGLPLGSSVNSVMLERVATVVGLLLLVVVVLPLFLPRLDEGTGRLFLFGGIISFLAAVAGTAVLMVLDRLPGSFMSWRVIRGLAALATDTRKVFLSPGSSFRALALSVAGHINLTASVYFLALGLGLDVTFIDCLVLFPPVLLVTTLPISIAGWGVREGAMVAAFGLIGVPAEGALVLSILYGLLSIAISLPGGVIWFMSSDRKEKIALPENDSGAETLTAKAGVEGN